MKKVFKITLTTFLIVVITLTATACSLFGDSKKQPKYNEKNPGEIYYENTPKKNIKTTKEGLRYADNEILVVSKENVKKSEIENLAQQYDAEIVGYIEVTGDYQWRLNKRYTYKELKNLVKKLEAEELVEDASIQSLIEMQSNALTFTTPNDSRWKDDWKENNVGGKNWGMEAIKAPYAWSVKDQMTPIRVGLIDNMFDKNHDDLSFAQTFYNPDKLVSSHGTHVAGTIAADHNSSVGVTGVYPYGENEDKSGNLYGVALGDKNGNINGSLFSYKAAFMNLIVRDVKVVNISLEYEVDGYLAIKKGKDIQDSILEKAEVMGTFLEKLIKKGYDFVITQAAGNSRGYYFKQNKDGEWTRHESKVSGSESAIDVQGIANWSNSFNAIKNDKVKDRIIVVGAAKLKFMPAARLVPYELASFSNTGDRVDVIAPGVGIYSTGLGEDGYEEMHGTSMAAPHVAGAAACVWAYNNDLTGDQVKKIIVESANIDVDGTDVNMINLKKAMENVPKKDAKERAKSLTDNQGIITGFVENSNGEVLQGVDVVAYDPDTGAKIEETKTDLTGSYEFILPEGKYRLVVSNDGYLDKEITDAKVRAREADSLDDVILEEVISFTLPKKKHLTLGKMEVIEPSIKPEGRLNYKIDWQSSNQDILNVSASGQRCVIHGLTKGTATLTATLTYGSQTIVQEMEVVVGAQARDTILVLDVSGSMEGAPLREMKEATINFCKDLLTDESNNRVGLVCYDDYTWRTNLTDDLDYLIDEIEDIEAGATTNMEAGLSAADNMMRTNGRSDAIKNIVVMADGFPNEGKTSNSGAMPSSSNYLVDPYANAVIDTAKDMMKRYNMYSLGFFHSMYYEETLEYGTTLMEKLTNMPNGFYNVEEAEDLQFVFGDVTEEISDGSKIIVNIACPVDVNVSYDGETLSSANNTFNDEASFGTLQLLGKDKDIKVLMLDDENNYDISLTGTGDGTMNYSVNYMSEDDSISDYRSFENVPITTTTQIDTNSDNSGEAVELNVDENGDGEVDEIWSAFSRGKGEITYDGDSTTILWVLLGVLLVVIMAVAIIVPITMSSSNRRKEDHGNARNRQNDSDIFSHIPTFNHTSDYTDDRIPSREITILGSYMNGAKLKIKDGETISFGRSPELADMVYPNEYQYLARRHCQVTYSYATRSYQVVCYSLNGVFYEDGLRLPNNKAITVEEGTVLKLATDDCKIKLG